MGDILFTFQLRLDLIAGKDIAKFGYVSHICQAINESPQHTETLLSSHLPPTSNRTSLLGEGSAGDSEPFVQYIYKYVNFRDYQNYHRAHSNYVTI